MFASKAASLLLRRTSAAQPPLRSLTRALSSDTATFDLTGSFETYNLDSAPNDTISMSKSELLQHFELMYTMRRMEITCDNEYKARNIRGFCHLYDGQEAVAVGMNASLTLMDSIITSYRDHALYLTRGGSVHEVIAELMGKYSGASKGKGGSMHMYTKEGNFYGGQGIVGAQVPVGAGLAFAHQYLDDGSIGITMYGDGAANQGQVFEAFNIAALWNLPCLFVCENNHYGMGTAEWRAAKSSAFYTRGDYMPGMKVDGMDVLAVKQAFKYAKEHALAEGPMILEMDTYRYHGHSMSDPGSTYRTRDEISSMRQKRDPIEHVRRLLLDNEMCEAPELKAIEKSIKKEIDEAVEKAKSDPYPPMESLYQHVYVNSKGIKARGIRAGQHVNLL